MKKKFVVEMEEGGENVYRKGYQTRGWEL